MQIKAQTDYAIKMLIYLSTRRDVCTSKEIATDIGISEATLPRVANKLKSAKWISSHSGNRGGFSINVNPNTISIWDVMSLTENAGRSFAAGEHNGIYSYQTHKVFSAFQDVAERYFSSITIADLLNRKTAETMYIQSAQISALKYVADKMALSNCSQMKKVQSSGGRNTKNGDKW
ncbi:MAG: Rrf2 family transcriptional regulator [Clostridia bacterium]|nr:Rrf2 family transcriptional regulator [Clostridia bacterium]